jgi:hypothetical protein
LSERSGVFKKTGFEKYFSDQAFPNIAVLNHVRCGAAAGWPTARSTSLHKIAAVALRSMLCEERLFRDTRASMVVAPLSPAHVSQITLVVSRAVMQWVNVELPAEKMVSALERVLVFLRQTGGASVQARQVSSLGFVFGAQLVKTAAWTWQSVSEDGSVNPAAVSQDFKRACLVVDMATLMVTGELKSSLSHVFRAAVEGQPHPCFVELLPGSISISQPPAPAKPDAAQ